MHPVWAVAKGKRTVRFAVLRAGRAGGEGVGNRDDSMARVVFTIDYSENFPATTGTALA